MVQLLASPATTSLIPNHPVAIQVTTVEVHNKAAAHSKTVAHNKAAAHNRAAAIQKVDQAFYLQILTQEDLRKILNKD